MGNLDRGTSSPFTLRRFRPISRSGGEEGPLVLALLEPPLDTSGTLQLILNGGSYLPGLHHLLSTMQPGEAIHGANVDAGYGVHESTLVFERIEYGIGKIRYRYFSTRDRYRPRNGQQRHGMSGDPYQRRWGDVDARREYGVRGMLVRGRYHARRGGGGTDELGVLFRHGGGRCE